MCKHARIEKAVSKSKTRDENTLPVLTLWLKSIKVEILYLLFYSHCLDGVQNACNALHHSKLHFFQKIETRTQLGECTVDCTGHSCPARFVNPHASLFICWRLWAEATVDLSQLLMKGMLMSSLKLYHQAHLYLKALLSLRLLSQSPSFKSHTKNTRAFIFPILLLKTVGLSSQRCLVQDFSQMKKWHILFNITFHRNSKLL